MTNDDNVHFPLAARQASSDIYDDAHIRGSSILLSNQELQDALRQLSRQVLDLAIDLQVVFMMVPCTPRA